MKLENHKETVELPDKAQATCQDGLVKVSGPMGELSRYFKDPKVAVALEGREIVFSAKIFTKKEKKMIGTFVAHTANMLRGVTEGHEYALKICSGHFPMNVTIGNQQLTVKNFIGEKVPRTMPVPAGIKAAVEGDRIVLKGSDKELLSKTAARMEKLTKRTKFDRRIFQDGLYIVIKDGKEIK
jgi:large subunit ribosomal protein L6